MGEFIKSNMEIIDCYAISNFQLHAETYIFNNPKKFKIDGVNLINNVSGYSFNEIGGMKWQDKLAYGSEMVSDLYRSLSYFKNIILRDDRLLFAFLQICQDKMELRQVMQDYFYSISSSKKYKRGNREQILKWNLEKL